MKKLLIAILVAVLSVSVLFAVSACKQEEALKVTITYDADGGQIAQTTQEVDAEDFTLLVPTKVGYTFKGWTLNGNSFTESNLLRNDVTLKAVWEVNKFNVTFDVGTRGTISGSKVQTLNAVGYALPTVTAKTGAEFIGWTLDGADFSANTVLTADVTLVAKYNVTSYTVTYEYTGVLKRNNETIVLANNSEVLAKSGYVLPTVKRDGYTFNGWKIKGTNAYVDGTSELADDYVLVADLVKTQYNVYYFHTEEFYNEWYAGADLDASKYANHATAITFGDVFVPNNAPALTGKSLDKWVGGYYLNEVFYPIANFGETAWLYEGDVYVYPIYSNDNFKLKFESGPNAQFSGDRDYIEVSYDVIDKATATIISDVPVHANENPFANWTYNGEPITSNADLLAVINGVDNLKDVVIQLYADFSENFVAFRFENRYLVTPIIPEVNVEYNTNYPGLAAEVAAIELANPGYHVEWFVGNEPFTSKTFTDADETKALIVDAKLVKNVAKVTIKVWGPNDDITVGAINGEYSDVVNAVENGAKLSEVFSIEAYDGYAFKFFTDTAWSTNVSAAPQASAVVQDGNLFVATNGAEITLYAYFYNKLA